VRTGPQVERRSADPARKARSEALEARAAQVLAALMRGGPAYQRRLAARAILNAAAALMAREGGDEEAASLCGKLAGRYWGPIGARRRSYEG
jgi:hypothetical protein